MARGYLRCGTSGLWGESGGQGTRTSTERGGSRREELKERSQIVVTIHYENSSGEWQQDRGLGSAGGRGDRDGDDEPDQREDSISCEKPQVGMYVCIRRYLE